MARTYLGDELRIQAEQAAAEAGLSLSAWVRDAIVTRLGHEEKIAAGLEAAHEFERAHGPIRPRWRRSLAVNWRSPG
jgi:hypothetical protein